MKQQYDSYKPSGIDWIGDIPEHWNIRKTSQLFLGIGSGTTPTSGDPKYYSAEGINWLQTGDLNDGKIIFTSKKITETAIRDFSSLKIYPKGSIVIAMYGATIGKLGILNIETTTNQACCVLPYSNVINQNYAFYVYRAGKQSLINSAYGGGQPNISQDTIKSFKIPMPPLSEQQAIADYLDKKCGEIDAAIAKVDREIELIDELKQCEISRVVTRGLNPDTPLRPSGIDWIGDVPEHWFNTRIKFNILRSAAGVWGDDEKGDENDIVCFRIADFDYDERCLSTEKITIRNIESKQLEGRYLSKGDLLIEKSGGGESTPVGRVVYCNYNGKATYTNFIHSITLSDSVDSRFFLYYFNMLYSNKINLLFFNQTTGLQNLQVSDYLGQSICLPPLSEQQAIADYLDKKCAEIDGLKAKLSRKHETLTELRQSIISEVVTGKRKVI